MYKEQKLEMLTCVCIITISQLSSSWNLPCIFQRWQWPSPVLIVSPTEGWPGWVAKFCGHGCEFIVKCCCSEVNKVRCLWASCFCLLGVPLLTNPLVATGNYTATSNNMVVGTLAIDGWAVTFGTARRRLSSQAPPCCTKCNSPPINGQCTNHHIAV